MALETYRAKRDFTATAEPKGADPRGTERADAGPEASGAAGRFVIQKHAARRLHYDFRLEKDGVLLSWAVTRGPSLDPSEKRLAVHVEDHPVEYGDFEGTIPKGEYGGGAVVLWDRGSWRPIGDAAKGLAKGHLDFELDGEKLHGRWHLVRMARRGREKRDNWLLIKGADAFARGPGDADILEEAPASVKTGRDVAEVAAGAEPEPAAAPEAPPKAAPKRARGGAAARSMKGARKAPFPGFVAPALATLRPEAPAGRGWLHEVKFDGYRLQAHLEGGAARLLTRTGLDWTAKFGPAVPEALAGLPAEAAILDGELVVETARGASDFAALQADLSEGRTDRFLYYAFDLLYLDGEDLRGAALEDRKARLETLLAKAAPGPLRFSAHFEEQGEMVLRHACRLSLEGIVSKQRRGKYVSGRVRTWIKSKCTERQEFVVAGYLPATTLPKAVGALLLGHYEKGALVPAGRVGTGFTRRVAEELFARLAPLGREKPPFAGAKGLTAADRREIRFVAPELVVEVEFQNWTTDGLLRHAAFRGIREDKPAAEVLREDTGREDRGSARAPAPKPRAAARLTHPDRIYWAEAGVTKQGLADYYAEVWPRMAPFVMGRPLALLRCPGGAAKACFFQKHAWKGMRRDILTAPDPLEDPDDPGEILAIDGLEGLIGLVQGAALEIHGWQAVLTDLERPDQIVLDLDPGKGVDWRALTAAARAARARLEAAGLAAFVKSSGGKGLHVVAPLEPEAGWEAVRDFAKGIAEAMAAEAPEHYVATVSKARRRGRILIDYLRNGRGATAVAPYSSRARPGAPVAMPLGWEEIDALGPGWFTVSNAPARLSRLDADPWEGFRAAAAPLPGAGAGRR